MKAALPALVVAAAGVLGLLCLRPAGEGAVVVGDGAPVVAALLDPAPDPRVTGVALRRWGNLRHFPDLRCGRHCDGRAGVVAILAPRPWGWRKTVLIEVDDPALDRGDGPSGPVAACVAAQLRAEAALRAEGACGWRRVVRWDLPLGL